MWSFCSCFSHCYGYVKLCPRWHWNNNNVKDAPFSKRTKTYILLPVLWLNLNLSTLRILVTSAGFCLFVCLSVSQQDNSKSYGLIFLKFWGYIGHGINYQWFNFRRDPVGILDSGSLWIFCYHCIKGGIKKPLAKQRWWRHLANSFALAKVPAGYNCFLVCNTMFISFSMIEHCNRKHHCCCWKC